MAVVRAGAAELGFAEEAPAWRLRSSQFPSKVGGRPAWLGEAGLPGPAELACSLCGRPLAFVLQLYAPLPGRADAFHRSLFLFCCRAPPCCAGLRVFRNQLPRKNDFYSHEPPPEEPPPEAGESVCLQLKSGAHLCRVCGCLGPKTCSRCRQAHYCSKDHQAVDWRSGHKQACGQADNLDNTVPDHNFLFPEFEIVIETEDEITPEVSEKDDEPEIIGSMGMVEGLPPSGSRVKMSPKRRIFQTAPVEPREYLNSRHLWAYTIMRVYMCSLLPSGPPPPSNADTALFSVSLLSW
ncbi:programmed cell death protein 2 isoform X3 [Pipistrellus kuhlii]|uniref:programmed cell death protein 2 isoform X3 n=1 Tax=Pipistrellus kuhlii TaxID=59472 RepID=UPI00174EEBFE|nr:programmed cell death protein 2 isoform X3 [Pipistrellus kuhlii]